MALSKAHIPFRGYWSSPFCRWQGALAGESALTLAAGTAARFLSTRQISAEVLDGIVLGYTVPQKHFFYGAPWVAALLGAPGVAGPNIGQACATSARSLEVAAADVEIGRRECVLALCCDRTSNGPHILYPNPNAPGGRGDAEDPVWDNFNLDPWAGEAMIQTAENVAKETGITKEEQDQVALLRYQQYQDALADDRAFQRRYLFPVELKQGKKSKMVDVDDGIHPTTAEALAKLRPVLAGGTCSFGAQTHPADGNAGVLVCSAARAAALSADPKVTISVLGFGEARVKQGFMPMAVVPAARAALDMAGVRLADCKAIKTHNPFAINDVYFTKETGIAADKFNHYGSPLVYGHPQGPTGLRVMIEMIEELHDLGGGYGVFSGCAAGDTAMAVVLKVG